MSCRAQPWIIAALFATLPAAASAQVVWQPTAAPEVSAESTTWYSTGEPIEWNGQRYYPGGAVEHFNRYQMVRAGSFRGIPLYTDTTLEPNGIVFVPLSGGRVKPYERPRTGDLAGTTGSRAPSYPPDIGAQGGSDGLAQAAAAPSRAAAYDSASLPPIADAGTETERSPIPVGTSGRIPPAPSSRLVTTLARPTGLNGIWIEFQGQRWNRAGKPIEFDAASLTEAGTYHGWTVYTRAGDTGTIYIPAAPGRLAPYRVSR